MSRPTCDHPMCSEPSTASAVDGKKVGLFCANHAPADAVVTT